MEDFSGLEEHIGEADLLKEYKKEVKEKTTEKKDCSRESNEGVVVVEEESKSNDAYAEENKDDLGDTPEHYYNSEEELDGLANDFETKLKVSQEPAQEN